MNATPTNPASQSKIKVLLCDDSALIRKLIRHALQQAGQFEIIAEAANGQEAVSMLSDHSPDCIVMDVEMPVMDGVDAVRNIRKRDLNVPILMFSTLTGTGSEATLDALSAGASDYATKPQAKGHIEEAFDALKKDLIPKLVALASRYRNRRAPMNVSEPAPKPQSVSSKTAEPATQKEPDNQLKTGRFDGRIDAIAIGVSTGGPQALQRILGALPANLEVPVLITQHMPATFIEALASRLNDYSQLSVKQAEHGEEIEPGTIYIAPGSSNLEVEMKAGLAYVSLENSTPENSCLPAVDPMFRTAAKSYKRNLLSIVLTGMGKDGLEGAKVVKEHGGQLLVQDEESSVVWGMPGACHEAGLPNRVLPLDEMANEIIRLATMNRNAATAAV